MSQARGYRARLLLDYETAFGDDPASPAAYRLPINSCTVKSDRAQNSAATLTGRRDPVEPFDGNLSVSGEVVIPVDARAMLYWLKGMFGSSTRTDAAALHPDAGAAVNVGSGVTGIHCTGHGLTAGTQIEISGTSNYDGVYSILSSSTANQINITKTYAAETFTGSETLTRCLLATLTAGAVTNEGGGKVGLPSTGHGMPIGAEIIVAGTSNYDGTYAVARGTTANKIVVAKTYAAETLAGDETATAYFHQHVFTPGDTQPSMVLEKQFTDISQYAKHNGCKLGKFSMSVGGDGELTASMSVEGKSEALTGTAYDSAPAAVAIHRLNNFQAVIEEGGSALSNCKEASLDIDFGLDASQYVLSSSGERGDIPEGILSIEGKIKTLFEDRSLLDKAINSTESSVKIHAARGHHYLEFWFEEILFGRSTPGIDGPQGIDVELPWKAFYGDGAAGYSVRITLRTDVKTFA